jgi:ribose transport system ATP-binding protein
MGENGAGKSTLMKVLAGIYESDGGKIIYKGAPVHFRNTRQAGDAGIHIVHQELNMMNHLTAAQNIFIGRESKGLFLHDSELHRKSLELFKRLDVDIDPAVPVGSLTVGKQQMVEIAKAISLDSSVLIFDEPTAALTDVEIESLFRVIRELKNKGMAMIYISHRIDEIKRITDRITVLRDGEYVGTRDSASVQMDEIIHMMVGRTIYEPPKQKSNVSPDADEVLRVEGLNSIDVKNVSFSLKKGEILGLAGLMGAGRTETARLIFGADPLDSGKILINGKEVNIKSPQDAVKYGIGYLSEDRKRYGLAVGLSVAQNLVLTCLKKFSKFIFMNDAAIEKTSQKYIEKLNIKTPSSIQLVRYLSGGNQQKLIIAKWLLHNCDILIFDEPTRGIDVGAKSEIYKFMNEFVAQGKSIIMISSEIQEILRMSDRILVMCEGECTGELLIEDADPEKVMRLATLNKIEEAV